MSAVFLDACVLYPPLVRALLLGAAEAGLFRPAVSPRVLDEWLIATARKTPEALGAAEAARARLEARFPEARVAPDPDLEAALALPDPADAHVLAAAAAAGAGTLLTFNLRDFPARALAGHGIAPRHPDGFLWELHGAPGGDLARLLETTLPGLDPQARRKALKRARLPRLGKAQEAGPCAP